MSAGGPCEAMLAPVRLDQEEPKYLLNTLVTIAGPTSLRKRMSGVERTCGVPICLCHQLGAVIGPSVLAV
jgi:hypothetical protein